MKLEKFDLSSEQLSKLKTPCYVYSESNLSRLVETFQDELKHYSLPSPIHWHYAIKANHNPRLLKYFLSKGVGIDLVSGGELHFARDLGFAPKNMVFSGVGKSLDEIKSAIELGIGMLQIESAFEYQHVCQVSKALGKKVAISFRVNPDIDPKTHPYISTGLNEHKFGMTFQEAAELYQTALKEKQVHVRGMSLHIGSQMMDLNPLREAIALAMGLASELKKLGVPLSVLNVGGGLGVAYDKVYELPNFKDYAKILSETSQAWFNIQGPGSQVFTECGRALTAQSGYLVTRVLGIKESRGKKFAVVDASMTELLRPSLYQAKHPLWVLGREDEKREHYYEVVGPVCESSDVLARGVEMVALKEGDHVVIGAAGSYGYAMASFYNLRPLPEEWWLSKSGALELVRGQKSLF